MFVLILKHGQCFGHLLCYKKAPDRTGSIECVSHLISTMTRLLAPNDQNRSEEYEEKEVIRKNKGEVEGTRD